MPSLLPEIKWAVQHVSDESALTAQRDFLLVVHKTKSDTNEMPWESNNPSSN